MGAVAKREERDGKEWHVGTGKLPVASHPPQWSEWVPEYPGIELRQCRHPDCDLDDYRTPADHG